MAKCAKGKMNGGNKEFTVRKAPGGQTPPKLGGGMKKGDSRSKSKTANITPSKGY